MARNQVQSQHYYDSWQNEIVIILGLLPEDDFYQIFNFITSTQNPRMPKQEAIQMILARLENPLRVLHHPKLKIDVLEKYFHLKGDAIPQRCDKDTMIDKCLKRWSLQLVNRHEIASPTTFIQQNNYNCIQVGSSASPEFPIQQQPHQ